MCTCVMHTGQCIPTSYNHYLIYNVKLLLLERCHCLNGQLQLKDQQLMEEKDKNQKKDFQMKELR